MKEPVAVSLTDNSIGESPEVLIDDETCPWIGLEGRQRQPCALAPHLGGSHLVSLVKLRLDSLAVRYWRGPEPSKGAKTRPPSVCAGRLVIYRAVPV
jgi:hypothetical protein